MSDGSLRGFSGAAGIQYGLNLRGAAAPKRAAARPLAALAPDSDEEEAAAAGGSVAAANAQLQAVQKRLRESSRAAETYAAALAQDANAFDYDGVFEEMKGARGGGGGAAAGPGAGEATRGPSRYIGQLLVKAAERERESEVVFERRTVKEREKEDHLYGDKEKFVTAAYKAKMARDAEWSAAERAREAAEAREEVTQKRDLSGFYANLLTKNEAFGAAPKPASQPPPPPPPAPPPPAAAAAEPAPPPAEAAARAPPEPEPAALPDRVEGAAVGGEAAAADAATAAAAAAAAAQAASVLLPAKRERASEDAVAEARARYLARRAQMQGGGGAP